MGTIVAQTIIDDVRNTLFDLKVSKRWSDPELLSYLNTACREAVKLNPSVNSVTAVIDLVAGVKQQIPNTYYQFIRLTRNMGVDGATPGQVIFPSDVMELSANDINWMAGNSATVVDNFVAALPDLKTFYNFPGLSAATKVEGVFSLIPADVAIGAAINIDDIWEQTIKYFILHKALEVDASKGDLGRSLQYHTLFNQSLGLGMSKNSGDQQ